MIILAAIVTSALLVVFFPGEMQGRSVNDYMRIGSFFILLFVSTIPLWAKLPGIGIFHPLFILCAIEFAHSTLTSLQAVAAGLSFHPAIPSFAPDHLSSLQTQVLWLQIISWLAIYTGYYSVSGLKWRRMSITESRTSIMALSIASFLIGLVVLLLLFDLSGGFEKHLINTARGHANKIWEKEADLSSTYSALAKLLIVAPAVWLLRSKRAFLNPLFYATTILSVCGLYMVNGRRSAVVSAIVLFAFCWVYRRRAVPTGRVALICIGLLTFFGIAEQFREANWKSKRTVNLEALTDFRPTEDVYNSFLSLQSRKQVAAHYPIVAKVPERVPYLYGSNYIGYLNRFVPRLFWKNKPRGVGVKCAEIFYGKRNAGGVPPGGIGEAYWSGGTVGVALVFTIWGMVLRSVGNFFVRFRGSIIGMLLYLATLGILGPSEPQFRSWFNVVVPAVAICAVSRIIRYETDSNIQT